MSRASTKTQTRIFSESSREAVETAIDLSKNHKKTTWEDSSKGASSHIPTWDEIAKNKSARDKQRSK